ncbi:MAG: rRNA cytosine-C5-methyltransferase [Bacteroidales bacterium]|nr:rRNA cytosine-C5-methyltransferase [Bacteroidales bacterium]
MMINDAFRSYLEEAIGSENALVAFSAFDEPASVSVRINPFKPCHMSEGREVEWSRHGRILSERPKFTLDPRLHGGAYYVQDSSSMFVGHVFRRCLESMSGRQAGPVRVLDLCAAPGGKSTDLASSLREAFGDDFILVSNEVMKQRTRVLADNMAIWGDPNVVVTSDDPRAFASLYGFFDIIVADVPCSGEGMFRKDEEARNQWSEDNVALCEARQRRIIADVWPSLRDGGMLVYSTCTFNRKENDGNVSWIAENMGAVAVSHDVCHDDFKGVIGTVLGFSLVPGHVEGEGQYCAVLQKSDGTVESHVPSYAPVRKERGKPRASVQLPASMKDLFTVPVSLKQKGETIVAVPESLIQDVALLEEHLHVLSAGCAVGVMKGQTLVPDADLALSAMLAPDAFPGADVDLGTALAFLHKDAVVLPDAPGGYVVIRYDGLALGFVKNLGNRCNNLHPQSRRIRMDIK